VIDDVCRIVACMGHVESARYKCASIRVLHNSKTYKVNCASHLVNNESAGVLRYHHYANV